MDVASPSSWSCILVGLPGTYFEKQVFLLRIRFGPEYPHGRNGGGVSVRFVSVVHHPLLRADGVFDLDIFTTNWSPALSGRTILLSLQLALSNPNHPDFLIDGCISNMSWEQERQSGEVDEFLIGRKSAKICNLGSEGRIRIKSPVGRRIGRGRREALESAEIGRSV